ncbi:electron transport complex subunit RsxC [Mannheimia sp. AT1]|uniref:Ion-translocating oxidoreductase complex subunit C n=1 Tax=Mannheimia cairinae TaxID=3025936 RepID=A0ABT5MQT7_9PAST|nr:electron transport complex subunit RsxC [Mannheimia cairinae]MDD0824553.1 electron transport complex subunit RsxC [Mannheimia cairinae]MDD0825654.1 electron transport complex subunit RsxC [Mannheimia cairinae]
MSTPNLVIERIRQNKETGKLWQFPGGIHPMENKSQSNSKPIRRLNLPKYFYVPVVQHSGWAGELQVKAGDFVLKGQQLTKGDNYRQLPVHSPTSGQVIGIEPYPSAHPSGLPEVTIIIETDGKDKWIERQPIEDFLSLTSDQIIQKVYQYGIAGLGGAVFPTASKLGLADKRCKLLIINGAECEPYITCDDRLMQDYTHELIEGIRILRYVLRPEEVVIAVEDNKPKAIKALTKALKGSNDMFVREIPTKYPSGASDQLVQVLTGLEIPAGQRTIEMGIVMHNVGTAFAVKRAIIDDEPLIERVVTLTGDKIRNKGNVWARLGTPIQHLLEQVDYQADKRFPVFFGGPMMGFILPSLQAPITKTANCLIAPDHFEYAPPEPERNCIRCSSCSDACPVGLLPQQLYWFARAEDHDKSKEYHLDACIECGVCAYVCPSYIPLIQYFRQEKAKIAEVEEKARKAEEAKIRFEAREARLQKEKEARTARITQAAEKRREEMAKQQGEDPVQAALARIKAKKTEETATEIHAKANGEPDNSELMAQRRARRLAKQAEQTEMVGTESNETPKATEADSKKAAVAAALARARAKKEAQGSQQAVEKSENITNSEQAKTSEETEPRKAAVAAALARAKAKKEAQLSSQSGSQQAVEKSGNITNSQQAKPSEEIDPRKAAVAAALARAKAKKEAQLASQQAVEKSENLADSQEEKQSEEIDPRKAAVAAALARAKAKKEAQLGSQQAVEKSENLVNSQQVKPSEEIDPRKAAVAAAIARAKAKKEAKQGDKC